MNIKSYYNITYMLYYRILELFKIGWYDLIRGYALYFVLFISYLELNPKLSNIWIRCDSNNILQICPSGILTMLYKPFRYIFFWKPAYWDINFYIGGYIFTIILKILYKIYIYLINYV